MDLITTTYRKEEEREAKGGTSGGREEEAGILCPSVQWRSQDFRLGGARSKESKINSKNY